MGWFVLITGFAGLILFRFALAYYISKNRRTLSPDFEQQLRKFRLIMPLSLSLTVAGILTLILLDLMQMSPVTSVAVWVGLYALSFLALLQVARRGITEWFVPFSRRPGGNYPRSKGQIATVVILLILIVLLRLHILL
ncbi:MAG: hypothetical protein K2I64_00575 [Muribaculaceae bacterium]|nr:hypothetical protein [Muribaculaceae bacterium]